MIKTNLLSVSILFIAVSILSGCATADRPLMSRLVSLTDSSQKKFRFTARTASIAYPLNTPHGESVRMDWLKEWLRIYNMCQSGYAITDRQVVTIKDETYDVIYTGKCTGAEAEAEAEAIDKLRERLK
jgi:hypothetical protein